MIEKLLQNPEKYRCGDNYKGTNIIFPVEFEGDKFVVKKPRFTGSLINAYYVFQDKCFYSTRKISTSKQGLQREAECLEKLEGLHSPKLIAYKDDILIRKYLEGTEFRGLINDKDKQKALENGFEALLDIHEKDVIIGDAHVKNIFAGDRIYWMDFDGLYNESDISKAKAIDILKFVYSTYSATRNKDMTKYSAELASKRINTETRDIFKELVNRELNSGKVWFATRLPLDGRLNKEIKRILRA